MAGVALLGVTVFAASVGVSQGATRSGGEKHCGGYNGVSIVVTKGSIACRTARSTTRKFDHKYEASTCGHSNGGNYRGACGIGKFHCRVAANGPDPSYLNSYCWVLKSAKPASTDNSVYGFGGAPKKFKKAFVLK